MSKDPIYKGSQDKAEFVKGLLFLALLIFIIALIVF